MRLNRPIEVDGYDDDGIPDLSVELDRSAAQEMLAAGEQTGMPTTSDVAEIAFGGSDYHNVTMR